MKNDLRSLVNFVETSEDLHRYKDTISIGYELAKLIVTNLINKPVTKSGAENPNICSLKTGERTCNCAHYCTRHGDQIDSIFA